MNETETVTIPKGTLIHVAGMPFWLTEDTPVEGRADSLRFALDALRTNATASEAVTAAVPNNQS